MIFGVRPNSMRTISSATGYHDNTWHHAVATLSPTTGMRLYLDGALVSSEYYQGSLAWASVHDTAFSQAQIDATYAAGRS